MTSGKIERMKNSAESRGTVIERLIAELASRFFMKDFVFLSPSYVTGRHKRQVTDLMFLLNQECILVSVKGTDGNEKTDARLSLWAAKKAQQASKNVKTACQRAEKLEITATNLWGETRTFPAGTLKPICGLGIVESSQEMFNPIEFTLTHRVDASMCPIHFLSANDFVNVVNWLGSVSDVFSYFKLRQQVSGSFNGINLERPLLCYYTLRSRQDFSGFVNEDKDALSELHQLFLLETLPKYAERDRLAAYVNAVIHQLHDRHKDFEEYAPAELRHLIEPAEKRQAYLGMAAMLNSLPMSNKAWIGQQIEDSIQRVKEMGQSTCFLYRQLLGRVAFVFAVFTKFNRTEKLLALSKFLPAAQYSSGMSEALGVGYDADDEDMGFEVCWRRGPVEESPAVRALADRLFSSPFETLCPTPFGEPRPYAPRSEPAPR
jgi:hypothetical protein